MSCCGTPQEADEAESDSRGRAGNCLLAAVAEEAVKTDDWWGQLGDRSIEDQLLSDLQKNGAVPLQGRL